MAIAIRMFLQGSAVCERSRLSRKEAEELAPVTNGFDSTLSVGKTICLEQFGHPRFHVYVLLPVHP